MKKTITTVLVLLALVAVHAKELQVQACAHGNPIDSPDWYMSATFVSTDDLYTTKLIKSKEAETKATLKQGFAQLEAMLQDNEIMAGMTTLKYNHDEKDWRSMIPRAKKGKVKTARDEVEQLMINELVDALPIAGEFVQKYGEALITVHYTNDHQKIQYSIICWPDNTYSWQFTKTSW